MAMVNFIKSDEGAQDAFMSSRKSGINRQSMTKEMY
jgi:hypothetical protein